MHESALINHEGTEACGSTLVLCKRMVLWYIFEKKSKIRRPSTNLCWKQKRLKNLSSFSQKVFSFAPISVQARQKNVDPIFAAPLKPVAAGRRCWLQQFACWQEGQRHWLSNNLVHLRCWVPVRWNGSLPSSRPRGGHDALGLQRGQRVILWADPRSCAHVQRSGLSRGNERAPASHQRDYFWRASQP